MRSVLGANLCQNFWLNSLLTFWYHKRGLWRKRAHIWRMKYSNYCRDTFRNFFSIDCSYARKIANRKKRVKIVAWKSCKLIFKACGKELSIWSKMHLIILIVFNQSIKLNNFTVNLLDMNWQKTKLVLAHIGSLFVHTEN